MVYRVPLCVADYTVVVDNVLSSQQ